MKYILALCAFMAAILPARADGYEDFRETRSSTRYQNISYESELRREFAAFRAERARRARQAKLRRLRALEAAELRAFRAERARAEARRFRAREARHDRTTRRYRDQLREERLLREENRRYANQRAAANAAYEDDGEYLERRATAAMCKPAIVAYGFPKLGRGPAERVAMRAWVSQVETLYSKAYANPGRARNKRYICDEERNRRTPWVYTCRLRAAPCRAEF